MLITKLVFETKIAPPALVVEKQFKKYISYIIIDCVSSNLVVIVLFQENMKFKKKKIINII